MDSVEEEERFLKKLEKLSQLSPEGKRRHAKNMDKREINFAANHAETNADILETRAFMEEAAADENWNHDQPL